MKRDTQRSHKESIDETTVPSVVAEHLHDMSRREVVKYLSVGVGGALGGGFLLESCKFLKPKSDNSEAQSLFNQDPMADFGLQPTLVLNANYTARNKFVEEYNALMSEKNKDLISFRDTVEQLAKMESHVSFLPLKAAMLIWARKLETFADASKAFLAIPENNLLDPEDKIVSEKIFQTVPDDQKESVGLALKALDSLKTRAKELGGLFGRYLTVDPYGMFADIRNSNLPILNPMWFAPVMVTKRKDVLELLSRPNDFQVVPYGKQMVKLLGSDGKSAGAFGGGRNTFILSTDDDGKYFEDASILKPRGPDDKANIGHFNDSGVFKRTDSALIEATIRKSIQNDLLSSYRPGESLNIVTSVLRRVPLTLSRIFFGIPTVNRGDAATRGGDNTGPVYSMAPEFYEKYQRAMNVAVRDFDFNLAYPAPAPMSTPPTIPEILAARKYAEAKDFFDNYLPRAREQFKNRQAPAADDLDIYNWVKSAFRNFFNNVPREQYVMMKGEIDGIRLMSWVYSKVKELIANPPADTKFFEDTMAGRLMALRSQNPSDPRLSAEKIAENIFGTLVGAVVGQEEGMARTLDVLLKLGDENSNYYTGGGRYTPKGSDISATSKNFFDEAIRLAKEPPGPQNTKRLSVMCFEAMRLEPQGETLLRQAVATSQQKKLLGIPLGGRENLIKDKQTLFAAHGSAMDDFDDAGPELRGDVYNPNRIDASDMNDTEEEAAMRDLYLTHGWGRHHCLGRYVSITMIVECARAILQIPGVKSIQQPSSQSRAKVTLVMDQNNLYAEKLEIIGTAPVTFAG